MGFHYSYPCRDEYDTEEEYQEAINLYEWAESDYAETSRELDALERMND